jgi:hypothetical protein
MTNIPTAYNIADLYDFSSDDEFTQEQLIEINEIIHKNKNRWDDIKNELNKSQYHKTKIKKWFKKRMH